MDFITLQNSSEKKIVKDVLLHPLRVNRDESGTLVETLRSDWKNIYGEGREFAMQYYSKTPSGFSSNRILKPQTSSNFESVLVSNSEPSI